VSRTTFTLVCGALALAFGVAADEHGRVLAVRKGGDDRTSGVIITGDRPLTFTTLKLLSPPRVVVDFAETEVAAEQLELEIADGTLRRAAVAQAGSRTARLVIELVADAEFDIRTDGTEVEVRVPRPAPLAAAPPPDAEAEKVASLPKVSLVGSKPAVPPEPVDPPAERPDGAAEKAEAGKKALTDKRVAERSRKPGEKAPPAVAPKEPRDRTPAKMAMSVARHITGIGFRPISGGEVIVRSDQPLEYGVTGDGSAVLLHLPSTAIPVPNNRRPLDTRFFDGAVRRVVPLAVAGGTDVRIELRERTEYQLAQTGSVLTVTFSSPR
jgi:hypothetical protein